MLLERNSTFYFIFYKVIHESIQKSHVVNFLKLLVESYHAT